MRAPHQSPVAGWQEFIDRLQTLPERMLAKMPERLRDDPQIRQEVVRVALAAIASSTIEAIGGDGNAPQFLPSIGQVLNVGQPNADTVYKSATIAPGGTYRLTGRRGTVNHAIIAQFLPPGTPGDRPHLDLADLKTDADGRFDVLLSVERPAGYQGDWWRLHPAASRLMVRMVSADWAREEEPTLSIERVDLPIGRKRPSAEALQQRLRGLSDAIDFIAPMFMGHVEEFREAGYVNRFRIYEVGYGALEGQFYYNAYYDLAEDEALIVESDVPGSCKYRSLILTNEVYETIDWYNNHSSLNIAQAAPDSDGKLRIVVAHRDPGVKNWLDTAGYPNGIIQGRWTGCDSQPVPKAIKVKLGELSKHMPADVATVTPEQRQHILRERRRALLERRLW
ncbi:MAG: hypothetical protein N2423_01235 [Novosphingobium sp.]|nr:hypothetical protein [Novosphingobium sp.]